MGADMTPSIPDRIRVRTITITAPQQLHRIGARALIHANARPGSNFSSICSKAISRLQFVQIDAGFDQVGGVAVPPI
ncbi:MAG: hypothetical protein Q8L93_04190 [Rhodocyclaceae bacterium]|nr:hypothetical protein [Rhodocyclaceae bacterium]